MFRKIARKLRKTLTPKVKVDPRFPFGNDIRASRETYLQIFEDAKTRDYPEMEKIIARFTHQIDIEWMNNLALHTQVVVKPSPINFQHGRLVYSALRERIDSSPDLNHVVVFETGTARGFSSICMSRAIGDANRSGLIVTSDFIPNHDEMLWNCIDDHDGPQTRNHLLRRWPQERDRIVFVSGKTEDTIKRIGLGRIHFAYLDGAHTRDDVLNEYEFVAARQKKGDAIVFDDVTPGMFDGIVEAIADIESQGIYDVERLNIDPKRSYAIAIRREP